MAFKFWWHFSLVTFHFSFGDLLVLKTFQFWWYFSLTDSLVLEEFLLSIVYCLRSTVCCLQFIVYWLALFCSYSDCLAIPIALPVNFDIPSQGVQLTQQTMNNIPNKEPLPILVWLVGFGNLEICKNFPHWLSCPNPFSIELQSSCVSFR